MKNVLTLALLLFLFTSPSPHDQNAEDPKQNSDSVLVQDMPLEEGGAAVPDNTENCEADQDHAKILLSSTSPLVGLESMVNSITGETIGSTEETLESQEPEPPCTADDDCISPVTSSASSTITQETVIVTSSETIQTITIEKKIEEQRKESTTPLPPEVNKSEDSIPSFSEWTKLQLAQRKEAIINNVKNKSSVLEGKNFASPDCGAKVINSNSEAQNPSGVISSSHDEYMLNKCTTNSWFILELCEPLTVERLILGNLELFSSNPHEFEIGVSDRYPTRDWIVFGPYFAPDVRSLHSFNLPTNNSTFGKYLRIVIKSHHGNEHYCPLSLVKVHGRSEYEVLESETTHAQDMEGEIPGIIEEEMNDDDKPVENSVIGTATQAVINMVKKAADVLVSKKTDDGKTEEVNVQAPQPEPPQNLTSAFTCTCLWQCVPESDFKPAILHRLSCSRKDLTWMNNLLSWCGWGDECQTFLEWNSIGSPWMPEGFLVGLYGPAIISALCHFKQPLKVCQKVLKTTNGNLTGAPNETINATSGTISSKILLNDGNLIAGEEEHIEGMRSIGSNSEVPAPDPMADTSGQNFQLPTPPPPPPPPPVDEPAQKESVFVRLSNRIKALERNQSLSSGYLEELSQRFKRQSEEMHSTHDLFRRNLDESLARCTLLESTLRFEVRRFNRNIASLRDLIWRLELQRSGFFLLSLLQILSTLFLWWTRKSKSSERASVPGQPTVLEVNLSKTNQLQRKRSCSDAPGLKSKKKKKRKEGGSGLAGNIKAVEAGGVNRIPSSLSTGSIPLRLPPQTIAIPSGTLSTLPKFEFKSPIFCQGCNGGTFQPRKLDLRTGSPPLLMDTTPAQLTPVSVHGAERHSISSDLSECGSTKSKKKKSKLKTFFFGK